MYTIPITHIPCDFLRMKTELIPCPLLFLCHINPQSDSIIILTILDYVTAQFLAGLSIIKGFMVASGL